MDIKTQALVSAWRALLCESKKHTPSSSLTAAKAIDFCKTNNFPMTVEMYQEYLNHDRQFTLKGTCDERSDRECAQLLTWCVSQSIGFMPTSDISKCANDRNFHITWGLCEEYIRVAISAMQANAATRIFRAAALPRGDVQTTATTECHTAPQASPKQQQQRRRWLHAEAIGGCTIL
jgi:hypothetical protein